MAEKTMPLQQLGQPPPYSQDFNDLKLPELPNAAFLTRSPPQLPTLEPLPSLTSITNGLDGPLPRSERRDSLHKTISNQSRTSTNPLQLPRIQAMGSVESPSPSEVGSQDYRRRASVSMQDADDRMAAEALCGLGKVESNQSHSALDSSPRHPPHRSERSHSGSMNQEDEPFLSLLASSHPWLGGTINGSLSAYSSTKSFSPRFIQYGADLIERSIGSPVVSTVGTVGRRTGMEGSLRRYLGSRRPSELEHIDPEILEQDIGHKRRRLENGLEEDTDMEQDTSEPVHRTVSGHSSIDTLPVYDDNKSPAYEESNAVIETPRPRHRQFRPTANRSWSTQLLISTSGLGAALNEASLRSLKYCLHILRSANSHVRDLMEMLKRLLSEYERSPHARPLIIGRRTSTGASAESSGDADADRERAAQQEHAETIAHRIHHLNDEIWNTLKNVVSSVSRYTGGALPENERGFVRGQLMSVPQRWQRAISRSAPSTSEPQQQGAAEYDAVGNAHRMLAFALEGLDMMDQVGGVVDSTIVSAEGWLDSMGRRHRDEERVEGEEVERQVGGVKEERQSTPTPMDTSG